MAFLSENSQDNVNQIARQRNDNVWYCSSIQYQRLYL